MNFKISADMYLPPNLQIVLIPTICIKKYTYGHTGTYNKKDHIYFGILFEWLCFYFELGWTK